MVLHKLFAFLFLFGYVGYNQLSKEDVKCYPGKLIQTKYLKPGQLPGVISGRIDILYQMYCTWANGTKSSKAKTCMKTTHYIGADLADQLLTYCTVEFPEDDPFLPSNFDFKYFGEEDAYWKGKHVTGSYPLWALKTFFKYIAWFLVFAAVIRMLQALN